jgi:hypothetical protein
VGFVKSLLGCHVGSLLLLGLEGRPGLVEGCYRCAGGQLDPREEFGDLFHGGFELKMVVGLDLLGEVETYQLLLGLAQLLLTLQHFMQSAGEHRHERRSDFENFG